MNHTVTSTIRSIGCWGVTDGTEPIDHSFFHLNHSHLSNQRVGLIPTLSYSLLGQNLVHRLRQKKQIIDSPGNFLENYV